VSFHALRPSALATLTIAVLALGACSSTNDAGAIAITASNNECKVADTSLDAGETTFKVTNDGGDVTEVYVYANGDEVKGEVENIGPGTSRDFTVDLTAGDYEVACKPGMKGDGIRTKIVVTGSGGKATATPNRTAAVTAIDYEYQGVDGLTFSTGDAVEFQMKNGAPSEKHEMEVFGPNGKAIGEVGPTKPGETGEVVLTLADAGTYHVRCGIENHAKKGMTGSFTVS
jgi:uncharacterized cupredoxin-like copper-binding protein